jgi:hypothetical protein
MVISKLDIAAVAVMATALIWIEHDNRIVIGTPAVAEAAQPAAVVCPDTDDVPMSAACIKFIDGGAVPDPRSRPSALAAPPDGHGRAPLKGPACPVSNENAPYSATCIAFISGWFWQAIPPQDER